MSDVLLDPNAIEACVEKIAGEISARSRTRGESPIVVSIRRGGDLVTERLVPRLTKAMGNSPSVGAVDITLYRDDAATALPNPRIGPSHLPGSIDKKWIILVDDVISTGRTIRAALDALLDFGRPRSVELAVLVDRGGRELPIQPDYVGLKTEVDRAQRVEVMTKRRGPAAGDEEPWAILVPPNPSPSNAGERKP